MDLSYLVKRLLLFFPVLLVISLIAFTINKSAPGEWVPGYDSESVSANSGSATYSSELRQRLGLDLPVFYFSVAHLAEPDTLDDISGKEEREMLGSLLLRYGNWDQISFYYHSLSELEKEAQRILAHNRNSYDEFTFRLGLLKRSHSSGEVEKHLKLLREYARPQPELLAMVKNSETRFSDIKSAATRWKTFVPVIRFHINNQYHRWLFGDGNWLTGEGSRLSKGIIRGDFGYSLMSKRPVGEILFPKLKWSMLLIFLSLVIAFLVSVPLGVNAAVKRGGRSDRFSSLILMVLYSVPSFWAGTMLLLLFCNPEVLPWFPSSGIMPVEGYPDNSSFLQKAVLTLPYLVLPTVCYTYGSFTFLTKMLRSSMLEELGKDYIKTARAKGLYPKMVIYRHAFRNALLPAITVFANVFPAAVGGSVIVEGIFSIPGMGLEILRAAESHDYPMITAIFMLSGIFTMTAYLIADFLYTMADPRISLR